MAPRTEFPPVRALLFDMDGLLIDSEEAYTRVTNIILREHGRPDLPWTIKAKMQGRPGPSAGKLFQKWAQLPLTDDEFMNRQKELQAIEFTKCKPLPGVETLLQKLSHARVMRNDSDRSRMMSPGEQERKVKLMVATSSHRRNYEIKTEHLGSMFGVFRPQNVVVGDDVRVPKGRGKPLPDIYLLALQVINQEIQDESDGERAIKPEECLVFEDSVPGVEAGRRAGMRVVWVPHPGLLEVYKEQQAEVLAGRTGEHDENALEHQEGTPLPGSPGQPGELDDGWAERLDTLEDFSYAKYGIDVSDPRFRSESGQSARQGTTDKELEEMTAMADGKLHAPEEGSICKSPVAGLTEGKM